jgi:hypothetical protein
LRRDRGRETEIKKQRLRNSSRETAAERHQLRDIGRETLAERRDGGTEEKRQRRRDRGGEAETERELGAKRTKEKRGKRREKCLRGSDACGRVLYLAQIFFFLGFMTPLIRGWQNVNISHTQQCF